MYSFGDFGDNLIRYQSRIFGTFFLEEALATVTHFTILRQKALTTVTHLCELSCLCWLCWFSWSGEKKTPPRGNGRIGARGIENTY